MTFFWRLLIHDGSGGIDPDIESAGEGVKSDDADAIPVHAADRGRSPMVAPSLRVRAKYFQGKRSP